MRTLHEYLAFFQTPVLQESAIIGVGEKKLWENFFFFFFKFRNLFCLIHKLYIALVLKKKKQKRNKNSENKTLFQSLGPSSFPNTRALKVVYTDWNKTKL